MAIQWEVAKRPISTPEDLSAIETELDVREEGGWDLEYVTSSDGTIVMFFKKNV